MCSHPENTDSEKEQNKYQSNHIGEAAIENALNNRRTWVKIARNRVFDCHLCHLSPVWRQMSIESSVSNDFRTTFVDSIHVFCCCHSGVQTVNGE